MIFHANHAIKVKNYKNVVIASGDTNLFVCELFHFGRWIYSMLQELWTVAGKSNAKFAVPVHTIFDQLHTEVEDILPAMNALTSCDTTSKVGKKVSGLQAAIEEGQKPHFDFGKGEFFENKITMAEHFLKKSYN